ncbi:unnamed protein product [Closterium sp. NIES-65]|nr:unnamed protein product [Closterium sp. NIES-65]
MGNCFSSVNDDDGCRASARERRRESRRKGESLQSGCLSGPPGDAASSKEMERRVAAYLAAEQQRDGQLAQLTNRGTANGFVPRVPRATSGTESTSSENISCSDSSSERSSTSSNSGGGGGGGGGMQLNCSMFSLGGQKGINQDSMVAWQSFAGPASVLCAVMDGHGRFGHTVSARVRDSFPSLLARRLFPHAAHERSEHVLEPSEEQGSKDKSEDRLEEPSEEHGHVAEQQWREAVCGAFEAVDHEVKLHPAVDPLISGSTAVVAMVQHDHLFLANLGDSRAVLARRAHSPASWDATSAADVAPCHSATSANATGPTTISPAHCQRDQSDQPSCHALEALALTSDHKCSDPTEAARIRKTGGRVEALEDEKHVQRIWLPNEMAPGLVTSRAVGDFLLKGFGVTCEPDVTVLPVDDGDEFIILATDGVWDVLSHEEAVSIVATSPSPATSAERLTCRALVQEKPARENLPKQERVGSAWH